MTACGAIGALIVGGRVVGQLRCDKDASHTEHAKNFEAIVGYKSGHGMHRMVLEWEPEEAPDLDLFDPDESFDVVVEP